MSQPSPPAFVRGVHGRPQCPRCGFIPTQANQTVCPRCSGQAALPAQQPLAPGHAVPSFQQPLAPPAVQDLSGYVLLGFFAGLQRGMPILGACGMVGVMIGILAWSLGFEAAGAAISGLLWVIGLLWAISSGINGAVDSGRIHG